MDTFGYQPVERLRGTDAEDTRLLQAMAAEARAYLEGFAWCPGIAQLYLAEGVGGVVAVFLAELSAPAGGTDAFLWIIVGDLPSAYLVTDEAPNPREALQAYCELMEEWIQAVRLGGDLAGVFPVAAAPTEEHAALLERRLKFLRERIL